MQNINREGIQHIDNLASTDAFEDPADHYAARDTVAGALAPGTEHESLKYHLLGPSLTKAGQDKVDQQKVCMISVRRMC